jgi:hypothetical protein
VYEQPLAFDQDTITDVDWFANRDGKAAVTSGALDAVIALLDKDKLFKYGHVHTSVTEYTIGRPLVMVVSVQDAAFRLDDVQALVEATSVPVTLVTFHDEKLQYELEQALAPAVQETFMDDGRLEEEEKIMLDGVLATTGEAEDDVKLFPPAHEHPSVTEYTYALFGATFVTTH